MLIGQYLSVIIIVCVLFCKEVTGNVKTCNKQSDCVLLNADPCAICAGVKDGKNGECIDIYPKEYQSSPSCEKIDEKTCPLKCGNGKCLTEHVGFYYSPFCRCNSGFGKLCEYDNPDNLPVFNFVRHYFNGNVQACKTTEMKFYVHSWAKGMDKRNITAKVKVGFGSFQLFPILIQVHLTKPIQYSGALIIKTVFPYKSQDNVFKLGNTLLGYKTNVQMQLYYEEKLGFEEIWDVFVRYEGLRCFPKISTTNCATGQESPAVFIRSDQLQIEIGVDYIADGSVISRSMSGERCSVDEKMVWKIWKLNEGVADTLPTYENYTRSRSISFIPFGLEIGVHELQLSVTNIGLEDSLTNVVYCYFKVDCIPLVARIEGGSDRLVSSNIGLLLRADNSHDPNMPSHDQGHLKIEWSCVNILNPGKIDSMCEPKQMMASQHYYVPAKSLTPGAIYNFTIKVWTDLYSHMTGCHQIVTPKFVQFRVEVASSNVSQLGNVVIECLENCGAKVVPSNELFLKAVQPFIVNGSTRDAYEWTYYENEDEERTLDKNAVLGDLSHLLIVKENSLKYGSNYTIVTRVRNSTWYAKYSLETYSIDFDANCSLVPETGIKGLTQFDINCTIHEHLSKDLFFEFYDKNEKEKKEGFIFSGRMLGTSKDGHLQFVRLTRGNVLIYILNQYGLHIVKHIKVELKDWAIDDTILRELYQNVTKEVRFGSVQSTLGALSFIPDIVPDSMEKRKSDILNTLLNFITHLSLNNFGDMKLCTSTLTNVLLTMNQPNQLKLKPHLMAITFKTIKYQTEIFSQKIISGEVQNMSPKEEKVLSVSILNCLQAGLLSRDSKTEHIDETSVEFPALLHLRKASLHIEAIIDLISKTLSYVQVKGQPATRLSSKDGKLIMWVMESDDPHTIPKLISTSDDIPVRFSDELYSNTLKTLKENENIAFQVVSMTDNIFWWSVSNVRSKLVSVSLCRKYKKVRISPIRYIDKPVNILVDIDGNPNTTSIVGTTLFPGHTSTSSRPIDLDYGIKIHRFDLAPRSLMSITFKFPQTNGTLRVYAMENFRPDYAIMKEKGIDVTESTPIYHVPYFVQDESYFVYIGIIPGMKGPTNQNVAYAFEINTTICKIWARGQWTSKGCTIKKVVSGKQVNCECTHFSIFAVALLVPPNSIDPFADAKLFLTVTKNPLVVGFVTLILLTYLLLCLCAWRFDKKMKTKRNVIVLKDNFPIDKVPYLIAVYTSSRLNAGTTAHVGIKIFGDKTTSRAHVLTCEYRRVLQRNADDWFLIYSPESLGEVEGLHIWHDNNGSSPEWLCSKIYVYDLSENTETLFIVDEWLALNENEYPEAFVLSAAIEEIRSIKNFFNNNVLLGLREHHVLLSCVGCHPRSDVPRLQRLSILMCSLMVAMLCSIMFYLPEDDQLHVDSYEYSLETREIFVGLQTMIISAFASFTIYFLFKKSYKISYVRRYKTTLRVRHFSTDKKSAIFLYDDKLKDPIGGSVYKNFVRILSKTAKLNQMEPVHLPNSEPMIQVRKFWLIFSWTVCITIICVSSYLVMLYGLKLGLARSKEWLSSLLVATGGEILFFAPIRIILLSSLLAVALLKMFDLDVHQVGNKDLRLVRIPADEQHMSKVIELRSQLMYSPLKREQRNELLKRIERKRRMCTYVDFTITIFTLVVLQSLIYKMWVLHFYSNLHAVNMMILTSNDVLENVDFFNIKTISHFEKYLYYNFVHCLYNLRWYNTRLINTDMNTETSEYWAADYTHHMFGLPVIRQLRVVPKRCDSVVFKRGNCIPSWSSKTEDKDDYGEMWKPATWFEETRPHSPWRYTEVSGNLLLDRYRLFGPSGVKYTPGGYSEVLGPLTKDTELKLAELTKTSWMDARTEVVFVEFSLYNVNGNVFTRVTLTVEFLISGRALPQARAMSFRAGEYLSVWNILFVLLVVYYLLRCIQLLNRLGIVTFIHQFSNFCRVSIAFLGVASLILYPVHYQVSKNYSESFHKKGLDDYVFDFDALALYYFLLRHVLTLLLCIVILHALALVMSWKSLSRFYSMFVVSLRFIVWFTFNVSVISFSLLLISNIIDTAYHFNVKTMIIKERLLKEYILEELQYLHIQVFTFIKIVSITICLWSFVVYFIIFSKTTRTLRQKRL